MKEVNESKFNMWRATMAIIYLDGKVSSEEKDWAESKIASLPFSDEQRKIIHGDLTKGLKIESVLSLITHKPDVAFLLHLIRTIGHIDGCFDKREQDAFEKLEQEITKGLDLVSIEEEIRSMEEQSYVLKKDEVLNKNSILEKVITNFKWWLEI